jgi:hypothetical protein
MISNNYSIDEFVGAVKDKDVSEVVCLALSEADQIDRMVLQNHHANNSLLDDYRRYSILLKRLIDYLRFEIVPLRANCKAYQNYVNYWALPKSDRVHRLHESFPN